MDRSRILFDVASVQFRHLLTLLLWDGERVALRLKVLYAFRRFFEAMSRLRHPFRCLEFWFFEMLRTFRYVCHEPLKVLRQWRALQ